MSGNAPSLSAADSARFNVLNEENLDFLMNRYNKVNRWVIADMIRRSAYHYPDKKALIFSRETGFSSANGLSLISLLKRWA